MQIKPQLVLGENNQVCMQIKLGQYTATLPIPDHLAGCEEERLQSFFDEVVPHMMRGLQDMQRKDQRKLRNKAQCEKLSTKPSPESQDETPAQPLSTSSQSN